MDPRVASSLISFATRERVADVEALPLLNCLRDGARKNDKRPAYLSFHVPDEWALNIAGDEHLRDVYVCFKVTREAYQDWMAKIESERSASAPVDSEPAASDAP